MVRNGPSIAFHSCPLAVQLSLLDYSGMVGVHKLTRTGSYPTLAS